MLIKGTDKINGILDLSSAKLQLKKGSVYNINEQDYLSNDVQVAKRLGFIETIETENTDNEINQNKAVEYINISNRTIVIQSINKEILPNQRFTLDRSHINNQDIFYARTNNIIAETDSLDQKVKVENEKTEKDKKSLETPYLETNEDLTLDKEVAEVAEVAEIIWNPASKDKIVSKTPNNVIDTDSPDPVVAEDDEKRQTTVMNPNGDPITNTSESSSVWDAMEKKLKNPETKKKDDGILFVDKENEQNRINEHPILSKKQKEQESLEADLDFVG